MDSPKFEKSSAGEKLASVLEKKRLIFIIILAVAVLGVAGYCIFAYMHEKSDKDGLNELEKITREYVMGQDKATAEELAAKRNDALTALKPLLSKGCVVGARANKLAGEVALAQGNYEEAAAYYLKAADKACGYEVPLAYFNAASCYESLNKNKEAADYYAKSAASKDNLQAPRAYFSLGRVKEAMNDVPGAIAAYTDLTDKFTEGEWTNLAKSRLIYLGSKK